MNRWGDDTRRQRSKALGRHLFSVSVKTCLTSTVHFFPRALSKVELEKLRHM